MQPEVKEIKLLWGRQTCKIEAKARVLPEVMPSSYRGSDGKNVWHWRGCWCRVWQGEIQVKLPWGKVFLCCAQVGACKTNCWIHASSRLPWRSFCWTAWGIAVISLKPTFPDYLGVSGCMCMCVCGCLNAVRKWVFPYWWFHLLAFFVLLTTHLLKSVPIQLTGHSYFVFMTCSTFVWTLLESKCYKVKSESLWESTWRLCVCGCLKLHTWECISNFFLHCGSLFIVSEYKTYYFLLKKPKGPIWSESRQTFC